MPSTPTILTHVPLNLCVRLEAEHWPQHQETWVLLSHSPWDLGCEGQLLNWFVKSPSCWPHGGCSGHPASWWWWRRWWSHLLLTLQMCCPHHALSSLEGLKVFWTVNPFFLSGRCARCGENVVGEGTGCTAMDQVFHVDCFTCIVCNNKLRGQPFYAVEKKAYCEPCYIVSSDLVLRYFTKMTWLAKCQSL